jgi:hypothetical protein
MWDRLPGVVAWTGCMKLTGKWSKTSTSTHSCAMLGSSYALIQRGERYSEVIDFEPSPLAKSRHPARLVSCGAEEPRLSWKHPCVPGLAATHVNTPRVELVDTHGLFASLVWHQIRPRKRAAIDASRQIGALLDSNTGPVAPEFRLPRPPRFNRLLATSQATSAPSPLETLFSQLARRRLRSLAVLQRS